jgi:hypothetical protein
LHWNEHVVPLQTGVAFAGVEHVAQTPPHAISPDGQLQTPPLQVAPLGQA